MYLFPYIPIEFSENNANTIYIIIPRKRQYMRARGCINTSKKAKHKDRLLLKGDF